MVEITAIIMAGGKSTRFSFDEIGVSHHEKPLLQIGHKTLIERVIEATLGVKDIKRKIVATSPYTLQTEAFLQSLGINSIEILRTTGEDYHKDLKFIVKTLNLKKVITLTADIPLIKSESLEKIIQHYIIAGKPALSVMSRKSLLTNTGLECSTIINDIVEEDLVPVGINMVDGTLIDQPYIEQAIYLNENRDLVYNINTVEDYLKLNKKFEIENAFK